MLYITCNLAMLVPSKNNQYEVLFTVLKLMLSLLQDSSRPLASVRLYELTSIHKRRPHKLTDRYTQSQKKCKLLYFPRIQNSNLSVKIECKLLFYCLPSAGYLLIAGGMNQQVLYSLREYHTPSHPYPLKSPPGSALCLCIV